MITKVPGVLGSTLTARVEEILTVKNSVADFSGTPDRILLQAVNLDVRTSDTYRMPCIELENRWALLEFEASISLSFAALRY